MAEFMTCFACENAPTQQCPRCGRPYCDEHGEDVCDSCLQPASGLPSFTLFRGSLLALLIGTILAVWLLIQPPGGESNAPQTGTIITPTPEASVEATPGLDATLIPGGSPVAGGTPAPGTSPGPTTSGGTGTYIVEPGDTLSSICAAVAPSLDAEECVDEIVATNDLADASTISVGQELVVPR
ncbi:MAG TPA: LysM domain-containing protein [Dehalococcoidia bacterium]|nr:LysM domain-containing protein [Dehalococcoidia bacterium]